MLVEVMLCIILGVIEGFGEISKRNEWLMY